MKVVIIKISIKLSNMKKPLAIMPYVKEYLSLGKWLYGGLIARDVGAHTKHKESCVERRLREYSTGKQANGHRCERFLERRYVKNPDGYGIVVQYRLR